MAWSRCQRWLAERTPLSTRWHSQLGLNKATTSTRGNRAESAARWHLRRRGLRLLERNYRCRLGEIDLICRDGNTVVFVEVRMRNAGSWLSGGDSVDAGKQRRLIQTAEHYIATHHRFLDAVTDYRFDVVSVTKRHCRHRCSWIKSAFTA